MAGEKTIDQTTIEAAADADPRCANCGECLVGAYCHRCGQSARPPTTSLREFFGELLADLVRLDSRALRSVAWLIARPGHLSLEYLEGRRVRFAQPLQLYLAAAAAFFLVNAYRPFVTFDPATLSINSTLKSATVGLALSQDELAIRAPGVSEELFGERFQATITGYLPILLIASVLLFAVLLLLFNRRSGRTFLQHAVFALHWSAFYLLVMTAERLTPDWLIPRIPLDIGLTIVTFGYLLLAIRRVYDRSWLGAIGTALPLYVGFQFLIALWMFSAIGLAFAFL